MKLKLPARLRSALLRCIIAAAPLVSTLATGTLAAGGVILTMNQAQAETYDLWSYSQISYLENSTSDDTVNMNFNENTNLYLSSSSKTYYAGTINVNYWNINNGSSNQTYTFTGSIVSYNNKGNIDYQNWGNTTSTSTGNTNNTYIFQGDVSQFSADIISESGTGTYAGGLNLKFEDTYTDNVEAISGTGAINLAGTNSEYLTYSYGSGKTVSIDNTSITAPVINFNNGATYNLNCIATASESLNIDDSTTLNVNSGFTSAEVSLGDNAILYIAAGAEATNTGDLNMGTGATLVVDGTYTFAGTGTRTGASATINEGGTLVVTQQATWSASVTNAGTLELITGSILSGYVAASDSNQIIINTTEDNPNNNLIWNGVLSTTSEDGFYTIDVNGATVSLIEGFALNLGDSVENGSYIIMSEVSYVTYTGDYIDATILNLTEEQGSEWSYDSEAQTLSVNIFALEHVTWNGEGTEGLWRDTDAWLNESGEATSFQKLDYVTIGTASDSADASAYTIEVVSDLILNDLNFVGERDWNLTTGDYSTIDVHGALTKSGNGTVNVGLDIVSTESINVTGGTLNLAGVTSSAGDISLASGATLNFSGDVKSISSITMASGSNMTFSGSATVSGNISVGSGATLDFEQGFTASSSTVSLSGGTLVIGDDSTLKYLAITGANSTLYIESGADVTITQNGYSSEVNRRQSLYDYTIHIEEGASLYDYATVWVGQGQLTVMGGGEYSLRSLLIGYSDVGGDIKFLIEEGTTVEVRSETTATDSSAGFSLGAVAANAFTDVQGTLILNSGISVWGTTTGSTLTVYDGGTLQLNDGIYAVVADGAANPVIDIKTGGTLALGNSSQTTHDSDITVKMATGSTLTTNGIGENDSAITTTYQQIQFADNATINFVVNTGETLDMQGGVVIWGGTAIISGGGTLAVEGRYDDTEGWIITDHDWIVTSGTTLDFSGCDSYESLAAAGGDGTLSLQNGAILKVADGANLLTSIEVVGTGNVITTADGGGTITLEGSFVYGESINSLSFDGLDIDITSLEFIFSNGIASGSYEVFTNINSWDATDITYEYTGLLDGQTINLVYDETEQTVTLTVDGRGNENLLWSGGDGYWPKVGDETTHWVNNGGDESYNTFQNGDNVTFGQLGDTTAETTVTLSQSVETSSINFIGDGTWNFVNEDGNAYTITNMGMLTKTGKGTVNMDVQIASIEGITVSEGGIIFSEAVTQAGDITVTTADGAESDSFLTFESTLGTAGDVIIENATLSFGGDVGSLGTVWVNEGGTLNFAGDINSMTALIVNSKASGINIEEGGVTFEGDLNYVQSISLAGGTNTFNNVTCNTYDDDGNVLERGTLSISGGINTFNGTVKAGYIELNGGTNSFFDIVVYDLLDIRTGTTTLNGKVTYNSGDLGDLYVRSGATLISNYQHTGLENIYVYGNATFNAGIAQNSGTIYVSAASANLTFNETADINALTFSYAGTATLNGDNNIIDTLSMGGGGTLKLTGDTSISSLTFSSTNTMNLTSLDGEALTVTVNGGASVNSTSNELGGVTNWQVGADTTLSVGYSIHVGTSDSLNISGEGTVEINSLQIGNTSNQGTLSVTIEEDSTLKILNTITSSGNAYKGLVVSAGNTGTTGQINVYGTLESNAGMAVYGTIYTTGTAEINVYDGGTLQLNRGTLASVASTATLNVNVMDGATLSLGNTTTTTDYAASNYHINLASGSIITGNGMTYDGSSSFAESTQTDVYFTFTYDSDAHITLKSDAGDTLVMHDAFTTALEYIIVTGGGTVQILQDGGDRAYYHIQVTGGTTLDVSSTTKVSDTLGYYTDGYLALDNGTLKLADGGNLDRIIVSYGSGNTITTGTEGGTLTLSSGIQYEGIQYAEEFNLSINLDGSNVILDDSFRFNFFSGIEEGNYDLLVGIGSLTIDGEVLVSGTYSLDDIAVRGLSENQSSEESYFTYDATTGTLSLTVVGTIFNTLTWDEADGGIWSTDSADTSWASGDSSDLTFAGKDTVIFDSSVFTDVSSIAVTLNEALAVTNMSFTGDGIEWNISGNGSITSISQLTKSGSNDATINVAVGDMDLVSVTAGNLTFGSTIDNMGDVVVSGGTLTANGDVTEIGSLQITTGGSAYFNGTGTIDSIESIAMGPLATALSITQSIGTVGDITIRGGSLSLGDIDSAGNILISQNATSSSFGNIGSVGSIDISAGTSHSFGAVSTTGGALSLTGTSNNVMAVSFDSISGTVGDITLSYANTTIANSSDITAGAINVQNGTLTGLGNVYADSLYLSSGSFVSTGNLYMVDTSSSVTVSGSNSVFTVGGSLGTGSITINAGTTYVEGTTTTTDVTLAGGEVTFNGGVDAYSLTANNGGTYNFNSILTLDSNLTLSGTGTSLNLVGGLLSDGDVSVAGTSSLVATGAAKMDDLSVSGGSAVFNSITSVLGNITVSGSSSIEFNNGLNTEGDTNVTSSGGSITFNGGTAGVVELADFEINSGSKTTFNIAAGTSLNFTNITSQDYGTLNEVTYYFTKVDDDLTINLGANASMNFDELIWLKGDVDVLIDGDGGTVTMEGVFMGYNSSAASLEITTGNTLVLTGTDFNYNTFNSSFNLAANGGTGTVTVGGTLEVNTGVQVYSGTGVMTVEDGGTLQLNAGLMAARDNSDNLTTTLESGATLALGNQTTSGDYSHEMVLEAQSGSTIIDNGAAAETTVEHTIAFVSGASVTLETTSADSSLIFDKEVTARTWEKDTTSYNYIYTDVDSSLSVIIAGAGTVEFAAGASLDAITMEAGSNLNITSTVTANSLSSNTAEEGEETGDTLLLVTGGDLTVGVVDDYTGTYCFDGGTLTVTESTSLSNDIIMLGQGTINGGTEGLSLVDSLIYIEAWAEADSFTLTLGEGVTLGDGFNVDLMGLIDSNNDTAPSYVLFAGIDQEFFDNWIANEYYTIDEGFVCDWTFDAETGTMSLAVSSNIIVWDGETNEYWSNQNWNDYFGADTEYLDSSIVTIGSEDHLHSDEISIILDQNADAASLSFVGDGQWTISNEGSYTITVDDLLSKTGDGNVSITADITKAGSIAVTGGSLSITGNVGNIGSGTGAVDVSSGSILNIYGDLGNTGDLTIAGGMHVDGNVGAVGAITVGDYLEIGGTLTSAGDITVSGLMSVGGQTGMVGSITVNDGATLSFAGGLDSTNSLVTLAGGTIEFGSDSSIFEYATSAPDSTIRVTGNSTLTIGANNAESYPFQATSYSLSFDIETGSKIVDSNGLWTGQQLVTVTGGGTLEISQLLVGYTATGSGDQELKVFIDKNTTMEITGTITGTDYSAGACVAAFTIGAKSGADAFVDVHGKLILNSGIATYSSTGESNLTIYDGGTLVMNDGIYAVIGSNTDPINLTIKTNGTLSLGNSSVQSEHDSDIVVTMESDSTLTTNGEAEDGITTTYQQIDFAENGTITFDVATGETLHMASGVIIEDGKAIITGGGTLAVTGQLNADGSYTTASQSWDVMNGSTLDFSSNLTAEQGEAAGGQGTISLIDGGTLLLTNGAYLQANVLIVGEDNIITVNVTDESTATLTMVGSMSYGNDINSVSFEDTMLNFIEGYTFDFTMGIAAGTYILFTDFSLTDGLTIEQLNELVAYNGLSTYDDVTQSTVLSIDSNGNLVLTVDGRGHEDLLWSGGDGYWPTKTDDTHWENMHEGSEWVYFEDGDNVTFGSEAAEGGIVTLSRDVITSSISFIGDGDWFFNNEEGSEFTITNNGTLTKSGAGQVTVNVEITNLLGVTVTEGILYFSEEVKQAGDITVTDGSLGFAGGLFEAGDIYVTNGQIGFGDEGVGSLGSVWLYEGASADFYGTVKHMDELHITSGGWYIIAKEDIEYVGLVTIADGTNEFVGVNTNVYDDEGNITDGGLLEITGGTNTFTGTVTSNTLQIEAGTNSFYDIETYEELDIRAGTTTLNGKVTFTSADNGLVIVRSGAKLISNYHHTGLENIDLYGTATFNEGITQSTGTINLYTSEATMTVENGSTVESSSFNMINLEAAATVILNDESTINTLKFSTETGTITGTAAFYANATTNIGTLTMNRLNSYAEINGVDSTITSLNMTSVGSHIVFTDNATIGTIGSFTAQGTIELQAASTAAEDAVLVTIGALADTAGSGHFNHNVEMDIIVGVNTTLSQEYATWRYGSSLNVSGGGTYELSGLLLGYSGNQGNITVNVGEDTLMHITGTTTNTGSTNAGLFLNGGTGTTYGIINVAGTLEVESALLLYGSDSSSKGGEINVSSGGTLQLNQGTAAKYSTSNGGAITLNIGDGGTLSLGDTAESYGDNATNQFIINLASGSTVTGNGSAVSDIYFSFSYANDANITLLAKEGEQLIMHHTFVDAFDTLTITGGGTVTIDETTASSSYLQDHNWYVTGGTTLDLSLEAKASDSLGYVATGTVTLNDAIVLLQDGGSLNRIVILEGEASTLTTDASGAGTITMDSGLQYSESVFENNFDLTLDVDGNNLILDDEFRFNFLSGIDAGTYDLITNIGDLTIITDGTTYDFSTLNSDAWAEALATIEVRGLSEEQSTNYEFTLVYNEGTGTLSLEVTGTMITSLTWDASSGDSWSSTSWMDTDDESITDQEFATSYTVNFDSTDYAQGTEMVVNLDEDAIVTKMNFIDSGEDKDIVWRINGEGTLSQVAELSKVGYSDTYINVAVGNIDLLEMENGTLTFTKAIESIGDFWVEGGVLTMQEDIGTIDDILVKTTGELIIEGDIGAMDSITVGPLATALTITGTIGSTGDISIGGGDNTIGDILGNAGVIDIDGGTTAFGSIGNASSITIDSSESGNIITVSTDGDVTTSSLVVTDAQLTMSDSEGTLTVLDGGTFTITGSSTTDTSDADGYLLRVDANVVASSSNMLLDGDYTALFTGTVDAGTVTIEDTTATFEAEVNSHSDVNISGSDNTVTFTGGVSASEDIIVSGSTVVADAASSADNVIVSNSSDTTFNDSVTLSGDITMSGADTIVTFNDAIVKADAYTTQINLISSGGTVVFAMDSDVQLYDFDINNGTLTTIVVGSATQGIDLSFEDIGQDETYTSRQLDENLTFSLYDGSSVTMSEGEFWFGADEFKILRADDSSTGNATVTMNALLVGYTKDYAEWESTLTVGEGVTLELLGDVMNSTGSDSSFTISGCSREASVELYGTLIANSGIQVYAGEAELNVQDGATLQMNVGLMAAYYTKYVDSSSLVVDIASAATLSLGDQLDTTDYSNLMVVTLHEGATITDNGLAADGLATTYQTFSFADDDTDGDIELNLVSSGSNATLAFGSALSSTEFDLIANIQGDGQVEFAGSAALSEINIDTDSTVVISSAVSTASVGHYDSSATETALLASSSIFALTSGAATITEETVSSDMIITTDSGAMLSMDDVAFTAYGSDNANITFTEGSSLYTGDNADVVEMTGTVQLTNTFIYDGSINVGTSDVLIVNNSTAQDYVILDGGSIQVDDGTLIMPIQVSDGKGSITTSDGLTSLVLNSEISYDGTWTDSTTYTIDMSNAVAAEIGDDFKIIFSEDLELNTTYQIFEDVGEGFAESMSNSNYMVVGGSSYIYTWYDSENDEGGTDLWVSVTSREDGYIWRDSDQTWVSETNPTGVGIATADLNGLDIIFDASTDLSDDGSEYNVAGAESVLSVGMVTVQGDGNMSISSTSLTADAGFFKEGEGSFTLNTALDSDDGIYVNDGSLIVGEGQSLQDNITISGDGELVSGSLSFTNTTQVDGEDVAEGETAASGSITINTEGDSTGSLSNGKLEDAHLTDIIATAGDGSTLDTVHMEASSVVVAADAEVSMAVMDVTKASDVTVGTDATATIDSSSFASESALVLEDSAKVTVTDTSFSQSDITMGDGATADIGATSMVDVDIALGTDSTADIETASLNGTTTITTAADSTVNLEVTGYVTENTITVSGADTDSAGVANISTSSISSSTITVESGAEASVTASSFSSSELILEENATATVNDATLSSDALIELASGATLTLDNVIMTDSFALTQTDNTNSSSAEYTNSTSSTVLNDTTLQASSGSNLSITTSSDLATTTYTVTSFSGMATSETTTSVTASGEFLIAMVLTDAEYESFIEDFSYNRTIEIVIDDVMIAEAATLNAYVQISSESYGTLTFGAESPGAAVVGNNIVFTVPEPSTATLSLMALAGLLARRKRRA